MKTNTYILVVLGIFLAPHLLCAEGGRGARSLVDRMLFFPTKYPQGQWQPRGLTFHDVQFQSKDNVQLHGWYCPCPEPRGVVLAAHGNAGHVASRAAWLQILQSKLRLSVFMFDYRGYGKSQGEPTVEGVLADARAARAKLREIAKVEDAEMLLMGESLGGAVVVQLAADSAPRGLILQSTFSSLKDVAKVHYPALAWLAPSDALASSDVIKKYRGPLLQSHGNRDETIPFESGRLLFQAANEPKIFYEAKNATHNRWLTADYLRQLDQFVAKLPAKNLLKQATNE